MSDNKQIDTAFNLFHDKKYAEANAAFEKLLQDEALPSWIKIRVTQYQAICDRKLAGGDSTEISLRGFSFYLNEANFAKAREVLDKLEVSEGDRSYLEAELAMEKGDLDNASALLKKAVSLDKQNAGYAINSPTFNIHLQDERFVFLRNGGVDAAA
jgi:tetratricopeptide (TPR) repeat protein